MASRGERGADARRHLTGEHRWGDAGQVILAVAFAAVWIGDTFVLRYTTFLNDHVPLMVRVPAGALLVAAACLLGRAGHDTIFRVGREKPAVIREGVFGMVRHPMYSSEILLYLGILLCSLSLAALAVWVAAVAFLRFISRHEEELLLARFGGEYERYMREVPMWIPRPGRRRV